MPPKTTLTETRLDNIVACLTLVVPLLNEFSDVFGTPFIPAIVNTTLSLITLVQNVKKNKEECTQLMENIHELLYAVVNLHMKFEMGSSLPPVTLAAIRELMEYSRKPGRATHVEEQHYSCSHSCLECGLETWYEHSRASFQPIEKRFVQNDQVDRDK
ncbi:hypothetical protein C8R44DRAFT_724371 [Mycena epipterygia]|nr:hypothetical protein C8R44DRAFT_724371 [Mycena epipterygia]